MSDITAIIKDLRKKLEQATKGEWFYNSYSRIVTDAYGFDEENEVDYPDGPRPGPPWLVGDDRVWMDQQGTPAFAGPSKPDHLRLTTAGPMPIVPQTTSMSTRCAVGEHPGRDGVDE